MKVRIKIFALLIFLVNVAILTVPQKATAQVSVSVGFQVFYDDLSPYGLWVNYPSYGYVWVPNYGPEFTPYATNGHWVFTEYGWTWVSDYNWGWAPFHYGRWDYDDYYGWIWMPDNVWGPAWVSWRTSPGYYGWTPLGPNVSLSIAIGGGYNAPADHWVFVNDQYMGRNDIYNYYGPRKSNETYINNSTVINNTYVDNRSNTTYIAGPKREEVEKARGTTIKPVAVKESTKPGQSLKSGELSIYRPSVNKSADKNEKPPKVYDKKEVKPVSERKSGGMEKQNIIQQKNPENKTSQPEQKKEIQRKEPEKKINQPKEENKKEQQKQVPHEQKKQEQQPKINPPKEENRKEQQKQIPQEQKKQEQQPKINPPKEENRKEQQKQIPQEQKKQEQQPKINQPKEEKRKEQQKQVPQEQRKQEQQPKVVQPKMNENKNQPPPRQQQTKQVPQQQPKINQNKNQAPPPPPHKGKGGEE